MNWSIDDIPIYMAIIDNQGVSAAATQLNSSKSRVSKALSRLEDALGVKLIERNSRNLRITHEGELFYRHASLIMEQVREADAVMAGLTSEPIGKLVVALPMAFAREFVAPRLADFHQRYPQIDIEIVITSHPVDIIRDQIDLAVVVGALENSELVARQLFESELYWVTSPAYAAAHPLGDSPQALRSHLQICEKRYALPRFPIRVKGARQHIDLKQGVIQVNDPIAVREAVINGAGVSLLPSQYCYRSLAQGQLIRVFEQIEFEASASTLSAIYPGRRLLPSKTRVFLDFLVELCSNIPHGTESKIAER